VLNRVAPAHRPELAATLLFEHWDDLAPLIQQYWQDPAARSQMLANIRQGVDGRKTTVQSQVGQARQVAQVKAAVAALVPDTADDALASEFQNTALALLASRNQVIAADQVPQLLATHVGRYFGAQPVATPEPAAKPKLAVRATPSARPRRLPHQRRRRRSRSSSATPPVPSPRKAPDPQPCNAQDRPRTPRSKKPASGGAAKPAANPTTHIRIH
jgi:hypothetical protein